MKIFLANPRGFCAGVRRALTMLENAIEAFGIPLYVKHEIVHNDHIVDNLKQRGVIFVKEIEQVPPGANLVLSAHGSAREVFTKARDLGIKVIDATCPLVMKVHRNARKLAAMGKKIIFIGHRNHPEFVGTSGQIDDELILVENEQQAQNLDLNSDIPLAYITQTTLSIDDTKHIVNIIEQRFPHIAGQYQDSICYATQNRQNAIKKMIASIQLLLVVGSKTSSNSNSLKNLGQAHKIPSYLIDGYQNIQDEWLQGIENLGLSAGASAPECLVEEVLSHLQKKFNAEIIECESIKEDVVFHVPKIKQAG